MQRLNKGAANKIFFLTSLLKQFQALKCCRNRTPIYPLPRETPLGFTVLFGVKVRPRIAGCAWFARSSGLLRSGAALRPLLAVGDREAFEGCTPVVFWSVPQFGFIYVIFSHDQSEAVQFWSVRHTYHRGDAVSSRLILPGALDVCWSSCWWWCLGSLVESPPAFPIVKSPSPPHS